MPLGRVRQPVEIDSITHQYLLGGDVLNSVALFTVSGCTMHRNPAAMHRIPLVCASNPVVTLNVSPFEKRIAY